ncbi:TerB family tellurite resistance protein [Halieaceae bacterium IMCC14734]|uniref:TerB family tellurite resistance protein n=1 Tax=Candidatus Litorirhabdus singularis TaxID=2518993 RepID=A0ABT3TII4_9GAMM|nr:TerB family tellurite resistance protein [Candidatus Litorirhabdus singularis]MCX2982074.1 TerB family tellurite resistance protein [Candidatus Litorirhabdus singularis]
MIKSLKSLFQKPEQSAGPELQHSLHLAAAALLIEMTRADFEIAKAEQDALVKVLCNTLELEHAEVLELIELGSVAADRATSLYEFTRLINDHYSPDQKRELVRSMWQVAYADNDLDKYEERLIRQVSDLIHVSHAAFIKLKLEVTGQKPG